METKKASGKIRLSLWKILAIAAGAMLFVTSEEIIPETHSRWYAREATISLILGFITMMLLESIFV